MDMTTKDERSVWEKLFDDAMEHADVNSITAPMCKRRGMIARYIVEHYCKEDVSPETCAQ